jgi:hypothetical protein
MPEAGTPACVHHWVLSAPDEESVQGRCKRCGATRSYPSSVEGASREGAYEEAASLGRSIQLLPDLGSRSGAR